MEINIFYIKKTNCSHTTHSNIHHEEIKTSGIAGPKIGGGIMFDIRRITLFYLEKRLSKPKITIFPKSFGGHGPFGPPGYACDQNLRSIQNTQTSQAIQIYVHMTG